MDASTITTLVSSVGFPIVACIAMGLYIKHQNDGYDKQIATITAEHKEEMLKVTEALNNNTLALEKLCERIGN